MNTILLPALTEHTVTHHVEEVCEYSPANRYKRAFHYTHHVKEVCEYTPATHP
jgi:hypothetical protein